MVAPATKQLMFHLQRARADWHYVETLLTEGADPWGDHKGVTLAEGIMAHSAPQRELDGLQMWSRFAAKRPVPENFPHLLALLEKNVAHPEASYERQRWNRKALTLFQRAGMVAERVEPGKDNLWGTLFPQPSALAEAWRWHLADQLIGGNPALAREPLRSAGEELCLPFLAAWRHCIETQIIFQAANWPGSDPNWWKNAPTAALRAQQGERMAELLDEAGDYLVGQGLDLAGVDPEGNTLAHLVTRQLSQDTVSTLTANRLGRALDAILEAGVDLDQPNEAGWAAAARIEALDWPDSPMLGRIMDEWRLRRHALQLEAQLARPESGRKTRI